MSDPTEVFACEPQPIVVEALRRVLAENPQFSFAGAAAGFAGALDAIRCVRPHIILIDQSYGIQSTAQFLSQVWSLSPGSRAVLWVSDHEDVDWIRAFQSGAHAILNKTLPVSALFQCLHAVCAGYLWMGDTAFERPSGLLDRNAGVRLTRRESDVVRCVARGLRNREIAAELGIAQGTVKVHLMHVFEKTGVRDRVQLAAQGHKLLAQGLTVKSRSVTAEEIG